MLENQNSSELNSSSTTTSGNAATGNQSQFSGSVFSSLAKTGLFRYNRTEELLTADSLFCELMGCNGPVGTPAPLPDHLSSLYQADYVRVNNWLNHEQDAHSFSELSFRIKGNDNETRVMLFRIDTSRSPLVDGILTDITAEHFSRRYTRMELDLAVLLNTTHTLNDILKFATETAMEMAGVEVGGVYLVDPATRNLELAWQTGLTDEILKRVLLLKQDTPQSKLVFANKAVFKTYKQLLDDEAIDSVAIPFKAVAVLPITNRGEVIGCMNLASYTLDIFNPLVQPTLETIANRLGHNIAEARALASLQEREENLNILFDTSPDMLVVFGYDGNIIHINKTVTQQLGYTADELNGQPLHRIHPSHFADEITLMIQKAQKEEATTFSNPMLSRYNKWIRVETHITKIIWQNRPALFLTSRDISAQIEIEEMIRSTADLFYSLGSDPVKNMEAIVKRACQILGGVAALYNRLDDETQSLTVWAGYDLPPDMPLSDDPQGHICYDAAICGRYAPVIISDLDQTTFYDTDPNVKKYGLKAYLGHPIVLKGVNVGSLAVVYDTIKAFNHEEINTIITLARALSLEEERLTATIALEKSEHLYRSVIEQMTDLFYRTDLDGTVVLASPSAVKITGYDALEELIGRNIKQFWKDPQKREEMIKLIKEFGQVTDFQVEAVKKDGTEVIVSASSHFYYNENGDITGIEGIIRDITERTKEQKQLAASEEKFRNIAENTSDAILIFNNQGVVEYASPVFEKLDGRSAGEIENSPPEVIYQLIHPDDRDDVFNTVYKAINNKENHLTYSFKALHKNGHYYYREDHARLAYNSNGDFVRSYVSCRDITERHQAQLELIAAKEKAVESDKLKSAFLANISHEIRTPLNGITGFAEVLKDPDLGESEKKECIEIINNSSNQLLSIITDIVDIAKIESGQIAVSKNTFPVIEILRMVYNNFRKNNSNNKISFVLNTMGLHPDLQAVTDITRTQQILGNLIDNALKFTVEGTVELGARQTTHDKIEFYVKDSGPGIHPADQEAIFERFRQLDPSLSRTRGGAGLGLAICKGLATMLGTSIRVESQPGVGSEFSIEFPIDTATCGNNSEQTENDIQPSRYPDLSGIKILVAEDEEVNMLYLHILLTRCKAIVVKAGDGSEALTMLQHHPDIQLILMDIRMPGMNGMEATKRIRKTNSTLPIVAQTACAMADEREEAMQAGCSGYITKPIREADFLRMLRQVFKQSGV